MTAYNANQAVEFITIFILFTIYIYVSLKQSSYSKSSRKTPWFQFKSWFNKELRCLVCKRWSLFTKWKKFLLNEDKLTYNKIRNLLQQKITEAKINHQNYANLSIIVALACFGKLLNLLIF